ncbi:hypothetical protein [Staphylococcus haemolyticus]|uniref:hypothetical protein n=1 Tax=Staphylococcus haemolyticus TaxID=1283 RepID=UPI000AE4F4D5|nr:hypothetical protein [Staphylococcus haemolyticus]
MNNEFTAREQALLNKMNFEIARNIELETQNIQLKQELTQYKQDNAKLEEQLENKGK